MTPPTPRTGARRRSEIPAKVLQQLNRGELETANLVEGLAICFAKLLKAVVPSPPQSLLETVRGDELGVTKRMLVIGEWLAQNLGEAEFERIRSHRSDTVRGWSAYMLAALPVNKLADLVAGIRPLADDPHFGVREWAWIAVRPRLAAELPRAIKLLEPWVHDKSVNLRRFAVECLRPRGVWCAHIDELKQRPQQALVLLDPLRADPTKYVQDSVSNWLSDAAKTQPEWVASILMGWEQHSTAAATTRIISRVRKRTEK